MAIVGLLIATVFLTHPTASLENSGIVVKNFQLKDFQDYVDVKDEQTTVLLEIGEAAAPLLQSEAKTPPAGDGTYASSEYYYVYEEYEDGDDHGSTNLQDIGGNKNERSGDHLPNPFISQQSSSIRNGWVPTTGFQATARPLGGSYIPFSTTTTTTTTPPPPVFINSYNPPKPVRTAEIPRPPVPQYSLPPQSQYAVPVTQPQYIAARRPTQPPQIVFVQDTYTRPTPWPQSTYHHYAQPAYRPYTTTTRKPESPRNYFPAPLLGGVLEDEDATTLLNLLEQADLLGALAGEGPFTVFAPTNEAFSKLDPNLVTALTDDLDLLKSVLLYHVVPRKLFSRNFNDDTTLDTLLEGKNTNSSQRLRLTKDEENDVVTVNGVEVIRSLMDQTAKNGIVHFIDEVIYPIPAGSVVDVLSEDDRFRVLVDAIESANLTAVLNGTGPYTVFAPTDDAFDQLPRQAVDELFNDQEALVALLTKHVVPATKLSPSLTFVELMTLGKEKIKVKVRRGQVFVEDARLIDGDIVATNGAIQVIDKVLL
jgi:uncharacterized surface protein with fasciclin (FAS1) repeats